MLKPEAFYLLRAPYLPLSYANELLDNPLRTRELLTRFCKDPDMQQAVFLGSPVLYNELEAYLSQSKAGQDTGKVAQSLIKYILRASCRCTPYGLFSGVSTGKVGDDTRIVLSARQAHVPVTRLDMQLLELIVRKIASLPAIADRLMYYPNSSSYVINNRLNYFESRMLGRTKTFSLSSVEYNDYLDSLLERARHGATRAQFRDCFDPAEFDIDEIDSFVDELIANEVIVHNLVPALTSQGALADIIAKVEQLGEGQLDDILGALQRIRDTLAAPSSIWEKQAVVESEIASHFDIRNYDADLFQVDLKLHTEQNRIGKKIVEEITDQLSEIGAIMPESQIEDLEYFKSQFTTRYESRELPLAQVLDPEFGIGYGDLNNHTAGSAVLIGEITNFKGSDVQKLRLDALQHLKHQKLYDALRNGHTEIRIDEQDIHLLKRSAAKPSTLPDSAYITGNLVASGGAEADEGNYIFKLEYFNGPSAATLLGRFCHLDDELLHDLRVALKQEELHKDAIYAEIVHAPQARLGNVIHRPVLRDYEIPYLSESGADKDKCIHINDLLVSVHNGEVILRSSRLNQRVIPCLSSAQNFRFASLPIYKFLCDLQHQGIMASLVWDWTDFRTAAFLPRVMYKKIVLSPATWNLNERTLKQFNTGDLSAAFTAFCKAYHVPGKVLLLDGDNKLLVDVHNSNCLHIILKQYQQQQHVSLAESFLSETGVVQDMHGNGYANEIIIPVTKPAGKKSQVPFLKTPATNQVQRSFSPGSEWLYAKIYAGPIVLDTILKTRIPALIAGLEEQQIIDKWFFIRYYDPGSHVRLRFHLSDEARLGTAMHLFHTALQQEVANGTIHRIQFDTYERELERYGYDMMPDCEVLFWKDSACILDMLHAGPDKDYNEHFRWLFALQSVDAYFDLFRIDMADRMTFTSQRYEAFCRELGDMKTLNRDLNDLHRGKREIIDAFFAGSFADYGFTALLDERRDALSDTVNTMLAYYADRNLTGMHIPILPSIIHMSVNRLFPVYQRKYEMIVYYLLNRHYKKVFHTNVPINS